MEVTQEALVFDLLTQVEDGFRTPRSALALFEEKFPDAGEELEALRAAIAATGVDMDAPEPELEPEEDD